MGIKVTNNAFSTLASSILSTATTIVVGTGQGSRFPTITNSDYFYLTLIDTGNNIEIVKCTARTGDTLTVVRGQDGTTALAFAFNTRVELRPVAALFDAKADVEYVDGFKPSNSPYATLSYAATITPVANTNSRVTCTGNITINAPAAAADGSIVRLWLIASGADRTVSLQGTIKVPSASSFTSPQTIVSGNKARLSIQYDATRAVWELVTFVNGY